MVIYGETLEIKNVTEGYTKEQVEQNIEQFTEDRNEALYELYDMKRETAAFNESGNKYGYEMLLDDTDFFTPTDFTDTYSVKGFDDEQVVEILEGMIQWVDIMRDRIKELLITLEQELTDGYNTLPDYQANDEGKTYINGAQATLYELQKELEKEN